MEDSPCPVLTDPWSAAEPAQAAAIEREASTEIGPGHPLSGHALTLIAACSACDSAAFQTDDGRFAIVHHVLHGGNAGKAYHLCADH